MSNIKNRQHYVFQAYLKNWTDKANKLWVCSKSEKRTFYSSTNGILHERQMYRLQELNMDERGFLELYMTALHLTDEDKNEMRKHINAYLLPFTNQKIINEIKLYYQISKNHPLNETISKELKVLDEIIHKHIVNTEEDFYSEYERDATVWIKSIINGKMLNEAESREFRSFLCIQYLRTAGMRKVIDSNIKAMIAYISNYSEGRCDGSYAIGFNPMNVNSEHVLPHIIWIIQARCSSGLARAEIQVLRNKTGLPFITADQPIVNMKAKIGGPAPTEFVLFYPLTPTTSIIVNGDKGERILDSRTEVEVYNRIIWDRSFEYVVSSDKSVLDEFLGL